jgi:DUF2934 family protein
MSSRTPRGPTRRRDASLLTTTLARHPEPSAEPPTDNSADAGNPNPVFADDARRRELIARTAYFRAEHRGFEAGHELEDWCEAEREVDASLFRGEAPPA